MSQRHYPLGIWCGPDCYHRTEPEPPEPQRAEASEGDDGLTPAVRAEHVCAIKLAKAEAELREVQSKLWEALGALGYPVPSDTPCPPRYECGTCGPNKQWAMKAEAEAQALREQLAQGRACHDCKEFREMKSAQVKALSARVEKLEGALQFYLI